MRLPPLATLPRRLSARALEVWPGVAVCALIAVAATLIGRVVPLVGAAVPAIVIGVSAALIRRPTERRARHRAAAAHDDPRSATRWSSSSWAH